MNLSFPTRKISEVCSLIVDCVNKTAPKVEGPTPFKMLRTPNIRNGRVDTENCFFVDEDTFKKWTRRATLKPGDTILTREAPVGEVGLVREAQGYFLGQRLMQYRADPEIMTSDFLHYAMRSPFLSHQFHAHGGTGSVVDHLRVPDCKEFLVPCPPMEQQRGIADILRALDDKIELNRRMSATLEEMARALYRSWFVDYDPVHARALGQPPGHMDPTTAALFPDSFGPDGLPKGWKPGTLGDIAKNVRQQVQPGEIDSDTPYIGLEHMPRRCIALSDWGDAGQVGSAKSAMRQGQILFGKLRPYFHKVGIVPTDGICSTDIVVLDAKSDCWRELVLCIASSDDFVEHTNASSAGTRMPRTSWKDMASYDIAVAPEKVAEAFSSIVRPMTAKIVSSVHEARTLAALRDALLPRLMSGELRIDEAEKQLEDVISA